MRTGSTSPTTIRPAVPARLGSPNAELEHGQDREQDRAREPVEGDVQRREHGQQQRARDQRGLEGIDHRRDPSSGPGVTQTTGRGE